MNSLNENTPFLAKKDDAFDVNLLSKYHLVFKVSESQLDIALLTESETSKKCAFLESYSLSKHYFGEGLVSQLHNICASHEFLNNSYWKQVHIVLCGSDYTYIPEEFWEGEKEKLFLEAITPKASHINQNVHINTVDSNQSKCIFLVYEKLKNWFSEIYPEVSLKIYHNTSCILEFLDSFENKDAYYLSISSEEFSVFLFESNAVQHIATYQWKSAYDILYFLSLISKEFSISNDFIKVFVFGTSAEIVTIRSFLSDFFIKVHLGSCDKNSFNSLEGTPSYFFPELLSI